MDQVLEIDLNKPGEAFRLLIDGCVSLIGITFALAGAILYFQEKKEDLLPVVFWAIMVPAALLLYRRARGRAILRVGSERVELVTPIGKFSLPCASVTRLRCFQSALARGLQGTYTLETSSGEVGRFRVRRADRRNPQVERVLSEIELRTGTTWTGRESPASLWSGFGAFVRALRRGSAAKTPLSFMLWILRSCVTIRGELAGVAGPLFRWGVSLFSITLLTLIFFAIGPDLFVTGREGGGAFATGFRSGLLDEPEVSPRLSDRLKGAGEELKTTSEKIETGEIEASSSPFPASLLYVIGFFGWGATCLGVNCLLTVMQDQNRTQEALQAELSAAREVQKKLLPARTPRVVGFDIAASCTPAYDVGGDYYDFVESRDGVIVSIADVSGKGLAAGLLMTLTKGVLMSQLEGNDDLLEAVSMANRKVKESSHERMFVSMVLVSLDAGSPAIGVVRAGHNPPLLINGATGETRWIRPPGMALGMDGGKLFVRACREESIRLYPGDTLLLYTDGLTEAMNSEAEEFGEARTAALMVAHREKPADVLMKTILDEVTAFRNGAVVNDDLTLVVIKAARA